MIDIIVTDCKILVEGHAGYVYQECRSVWNVVRSYRVSITQIGVYGGDVPCTLKNTAKITKA